MAERLKIVVIVSSSIHTWNENISLLLCHINGVKDSSFHSINDFRCTGVSGNASSMSVYAALSFALWLVEETLTSSSNPSGVSSVLLATFPTFDAHQSRIPLNLKSLLILFPSCYCSVLGRCNCQRKVFSPIWFEAPCQQGEIFFTPPKAFDCNEKMSKESEVRSLLKRRAFGGTFPLVSLVVVDK